jgi:hypothetical protein
MWDLRIGIEGKVRERERERSVGFGICKGRELYIAGLNELDFV